MLDRMSTLVRGDPERCNGRRSVNFRRQAKPAVGRVVVVAQRVADLNNFDIIDASSKEDPLRRLGPGDVRNGPHLAPTLKGTRYFRLGPETDQHRDSDQ